MKKLSIILLISSLLLISCAKIKQVEDQVDTMESTMINMDSNMANMYAQARQDASEKKRADKKAILLDTTQGIGEKLAAASIYFKSFEYQLWTATAFDTKEKREHLQEEAIAEFYRFMVDIYTDVSTTSTFKKILFIRPQLKKMSPIHLNKTTNSARAFYALATTLHINNSYQENLFKKDQESEISILKIIKSALKKFKDGTEMNKAEKIVLTGKMNKEITHNLLRLRRDMLIALALKDLVTQDDMDYKDKAEGLLFQMSQGHFGELKLDSTFEQVNYLTKEDIHTKLDAALTTHKFIRDMQLDLKMDKSIRSILKNTSFDPNGINDEEIAEVNSIISRLL